MGVHDPTGESDVERLARRIGRLTVEPLPPDVVEAGKACLLYGLTMACAAGPAPEPVRDLLTTSAAGPGEADLLVGGGRARAANAAAVNAALFAARGQNDTHPALAGHVGCIVIPAALAVAQRHGGDGAALLRGIVAGYEATVTLANGVAGHARARGLRTTSLFGPAGAAAAVAATLGWDARRTAAAIAFGLDAGSGTLQCWSEGSAEWRWQIARSAADGVTAAALAAAGATAARFAHEGEHGFLAAHVGACGAPITAEPAWHVRAVELKAFPGCYINQAATAALVAWLRESGCCDSDVEIVEVRLHPADRAYPGVAAWGPFGDPGAAVMSLPFMLAAALRDGTVTAGHFATEYATSALHASSRKVAIARGDGIAPYGAQIRLSFASGRNVTLPGASLARAGNGLTATASMTAGVAGEWPWPDAERRFADLVAAIARLETCEIGDLLRACLP